MMNDPIDILVSDEVEDAGISDEAEVHRRALELTEAALDDPVHGSAVLRAAAMLMAYLASHQSEPERALAMLIAEQSGNAHTCLHRMKSQPIGTA